MTENVLKPATALIHCPSAEEVAEVFLRSRFPLPTRFTEPTHVSNLFRLKTGSPKAITALWKVWRQDSGYRRAWDCWRRILRNEKKQKRALDNAWKQLKSVPYSGEHHAKRCELNQAEFRLWNRKRRFLTSFAKRYGIPPLDPKSTQINYDVAKAIQTWTVGKWQQPVWTVDDKVDMENARSIQRRGKESRYGPSSLLIVIDPHYPEPKLLAAVKKHVADWNKRRLSKPWKWGHPREELFDDYAKAWYLHKINGKTFAEVASEFGWVDAGYKEKVQCLKEEGRFAAAKKRRKRHASRRHEAWKKARLYVASGQHLHDGAPELIRGKQTSGWRPKREARQAQERQARILLKMRGGSKLKT